jgi:RNA methyltransferase, TrmH family
MADLIGARHPTMQRLRRLSRRRSARTDEGAFVVDGPTLLADALDAGVPVEAVVVEADARDDAGPGDGAEAVAATVDRAAAAGAAVHRTHAGTLARVTDTVTPHGVAAIARFPDRPLPEVVAAAGALCLVLVAVSDPGNAGTLLRSAEAAGAGGVVFCDGSVDPFGPKCVRSSAGSVFRVAVSRDGDSAAAIAACSAAGTRTVATLARGAPPYDEADLAGPVALVLGSEAHGLPAAVSDAVDAAVTIPMAGQTESLNVAMAGTVLCFEALRQRRRRHRASDLPNGLDGPPPRAAGFS